MSIELAQGHTYRKALHIEPGIIIFCRLVDLTLLSKPRLIVFLAAALFAPAAAGCGGPPDMTADYGEAREPNERLTALIEMDQRVARVAQRLSDANVDLCPVVRESAGWALHAASQYSEALRPLAIQRFGLNGDLPGVLASPDGSAGSEAGLRQGDLILAVNGHPLDAGASRSAPAFEGFSANVRRLDQALSEGSVRLDIQRDGQVRQVIVTPRRSCGYEVQLNPSDELNARADGRRLFISTALTAFAENDHELSIILGHELAHNVLRHRAWDEAGGVGRTANGSSGPGVGRGHPERQADRVGMFLAARAGYDTRVAAPFWRRFGASNWRVRYPQLKHDSAGARALALENVQDEIDEQRRNGAPLAY